MKYVDCTFCGKFARKSSEPGCCITCNVGFERNIGTFEPILSARKCRGCSARLPQSRYFNCESCVQLDSECEFDTCLPIVDRDGDSINKVTALQRTAASDHTHKICRKCGGAPQPLTDFTIDVYNKDGRQNTCRKCNALYAKRRRDRLKSIAA